jgi:hypothetical protein
MRDGGGVTNSNKSGGCNLAVEGSAVFLPGSLDVRFNAEKIIVDLPIVTKLRTTDGGGMSRSMLK